MRFSHNGRAQTKPRQIEYQVDIILRVPSLSSRGRSRTRTRNQQGDKGDYSYTKDPKGRQHEYDCFLSNEKTGSCGKAHGGSSQAHDTRSGRAKYISPMSVGFERETTAADEMY